MLLSIDARAPGRVALVAILIAACGQPGPSTGASAATPSAPPLSSASTSPGDGASLQPSAPPSAVPTEPPPTDGPPTEAPEDTPKPIDPSCPNATDDTISVQEYVDATTGCFRYGVRVRGWLDTPPPLGFEAPLVKPTWLYYPDGDMATSLWHQPPPEPDHVCSSGEDCWWFFPHPDPELDLSLEPLQRWVILTGHTRDPRAQNCHYDGVGPNPNPDLVTVCGRQFVVTAIEAAP